jgi:hypothetical protein
MHACVNVHACKCVYVQLMLIYVHAHIHRVLHVYNRKQVCVMCIYIQHVGKECESQTAHIFHGMDIYKRVSMDV